jgi:hypothetical protein
LVIDGGALLDQGYPLSEFSDPIFGPGICDWEEEIACWSDVKPLRNFLVAITEVSDQQYRDYHKIGRDAFRPGRPSRPRRRRGASIMDAWYAQWRDAGLLGRAAT